ncbi:adenylate kinase [Flavobacteriaceae bacterium R38]|nr:adenylate kinase [Flavobacteriaceae bacterium R38]
MVRLHDKYFRPFISKSEIEIIVHRMASEIYSSLKDENPVFVVVLNGAFVFASDFAKNYPGNCEFEFVRLASYEGTNSSGEVKQLLGLNKSLEERTVVVLEDIIDTGNTLEEITEIFSKEKIKQLYIATLFFKPEVFKKEIKIDYIGLKIPNKFIVGYGLDYNGLGRNFSQVYELNNNRMINLVLFGKPGAGKGTQANFLKEKYQLVHISTGDVFRFNIKNETELGNLAKSYMDKGDLVPDEITINMLNAEVEKNPDANGFIFDGFPRTTKQAKALDDLLASKNIAVNATIALEANDEVLIERLLERGKSSGRSDDQDEGKIRNRFDEYNQKTAPLIDYYKNEEKFFSVDGIGSIEEITERLSDVIDGLMISSK